MKSGFLHILFTVTVLLLADVNVNAETAAFGFFINESGNESYDYLEKILPNSFAGALKKKYSFHVIKPGQIPAFTLPEYEIIKKQVIKEEDLVNITKDINTDYLIYGSFVPLEDNKIKLTVSIYKKGSNSVFQFEDSGFLETEFFKLVDKIAVQIKNAANDTLIYKNETVKSKSKLAILTNIEGDELNSLYCEFLNGGYKISPTQGNDIYGLMDDKQITKFYHFNGVNASYHLIHNRKDIQLFYGTWSGDDYNKKILADKKTYEQYTFNYQKTSSAIIEKIKAFKTDDIDYIVVIGFDEKRTNAWVRCLNLKDNKLIVTETGITGKSVDEITKNIIKSLTTGFPEKL